MTRNRAEIARASSQPGNDAVFDPQPRLANPTEFIPPGLKGPARKRHRSASSRVVRSRPGVAKAPSREA